MESAKFAVQITALSDPDLDPEAAFSSRRLRTWPYPGPVRLEESDASRTEGHVFIIDNWRLVQAIRYDEGGTRTFLQAQTGFDHNAYKILAKHLLCHERSVKLLNISEIRRFCEETETTAWS